MSEIDLRMRDPAIPMSRAVSALHFLGMIIPENMTELFFSSNPVSVIYI